MKNKLFIIALLMLSITSCNNNPKEDTQEVKELKQEVEDLKANVKELEDEKTEADKLNDDKPNKAEERIEDIKESNPETKPEDDENIADLIVKNLELTTKDAPSSTIFNQSIDLIKNNPDILLSDEASDSILDRFYYVKWNELDTDSDAVQPITVIDGTLLREYEATHSSDKYNLYQIGFLPSNGTEDTGFFELLYCGNIRNYLYPGFKGNDYLKIWALPVGYYTRTNDEGESYTVYTFVSSETFQHTAYKYITNQSN